MKRALLSTALAAAICPASVSWAQDQSATQEKLSPREALEKRFQEFPLHVGEPFPEVDIYDARGKPFSTKSLKGKYTVIVNGCLT